MLGFFTLFLIAYIVYLHAKLIRRGLPQAEKPEFVYEKPELPKALQSVADRLEAWRQDGRLSAEEHEKLMHFVWEDAAAKAGKIPS
jgi:hypothetical protein